MALWDSGIWDTAKWSTIEATLGITLDDVSVSATGQTGHVGTVSVPLADISVVMAGQDVHAGPLSVQLEDISVAGTGSITRHADLAVTLDNIAFDATGTHQHNDDFTVVLDEITFYAEGTAGEMGSRRGGFDVPKKRKTPIKKNQDAEIEAQVQKAINKVFGIEEPESQVDESVKPQVDYTDKIQALMLEAHINALGRQVDEYERAIIAAEIAAELDDEETILFLI